MKTFMIEGARAMILLLAVVGTFACFTGCGGRDLTPEEQERVDALDKRNKELIDQMSAIRERAKTGGSVEFLQLAALLKPLQEQFEANSAELKKLQVDTGMPWWQTAFVFFHRTILHGVKAAIPAAGGPIVLGINALLTFLLGGSSTKHLPAEVKPATSTGAPPPVG